MNSPGPTASSSTSPTPRTATSPYAISKREVVSGAFAPVSRCEGGNGSNWVEVVAADANLINRLDLERAVRAAFYR